MFHTMAKRNVPGVEHVYRASDLWVNRCLRHRLFLFDGTEHGWTPERLSELHRLSSVAPGPGEPFLHWLGARLHSTSEEVKQLAAEVLYVHLLVTTSITGERKRELVRTVLAWMDYPPSINPILDQAFEHGLVRPGTFFSAQRHVAFAYLLHFAQAWALLSPHLTRNALVDPWRFKQMLDQVPVGLAFAQRNAVLHLVHPATFDPVLSDAQKRMITGRFRAEAGHPDDDIDRQLVRVRRALRPADPDRFDFYSSDVVAQWATERRLQDG